MGRERREEHLRGIGLHQPGRPVGGTVRYKQEDGGIGEAFNQRREPVFRRGVAPVQILDGDDQRPLPTAREERLAEGGKGPDAARFRAQHCEPTACSCTPRRWRRYATLSSEAMAFSWRRCDTFAAMASAESVSMIPQYCCTISRSGT